MPKTAKTDSKKNTSSPDHDRIFKELLAVFFLEFLKLFFPDTLKYLEEDSLVALDKEIFTDISKGERHEVDLIMRAKFKPEFVVQKKRRKSKKLDTGEEQPDNTAYFIIHVEAQASSKSDFPRRMFIYFSRLTEKYNHAVYPIVVFSFDSPKKKAATQYEVKFPSKKVLQFNYDAIQLNQLDWHDFVSNPNPVASALMAKMNIAPEDRPIVKLQCLKMLVGLKLNPARTQLISGFINTYLKLDAQQKQVLEAELEKLEPGGEKEQVMQVMNEWIEEGIVQGEFNTVMRQLRRKLSYALTVEIENRIRQLSQDKIDKLSEDLLDFSSEKDLTNWLDQNVIQ